MPSITRDQEIRIAPSDVGIGGPCNRLSQGRAYLAIRFHGAQAFDPFDNADYIREESELVLRVCDPQVAASVLVAHCSSEPPCKKRKLFV